MKNIIPPAESKAMKVLLPLVIIICILVYLPSGQMWGRMNALGYTGLIGFGLIMVMIICFDLYVSKHETEEDDDNNMVKRN